jgi:hypothetical protein
MEPILVLVEVVEVVLVHYMVQEEIRTQEMVVVVLLLVVLV